MKKLITEADVLKLVRQGLKELYIDENTILTPSAKDVIIREKIELRNIQLKQLSSDSSASKNLVKTIAIGSDHTGFKVKKELINFLSSQGFQVIDVGTNSEQSCDYPDFAYAVAFAVKNNQAERGIVIDATGIPSAMVANKVKGIRAAVGYNEYAIKSSREHNNSNVLSLGARVFDVEILKSFISLWLQTDFEGGRHQKRLDKITDIENRNS
ncbi:MAG: ribose 5-phosphate isomerase B [Ignavibacteria bacterium]|nr:ribose 5-phosphate isomerase B [Ignavibacteria bacterium]